MLNYAIKNHETIAWKVMNYKGNAKEFVQENLAIEISKKMKSKCKNIGHNHKDMMNPC